MRAKSRAIVVSAAVGLFLGAYGSSGQAQPGPEDGGAILRTGFDDPAPRAAPKSQSPSQSAPTGDSGPSADQILAHLAVDPRYILNNDIRPTPDLGPWMVCVHSYVTKEAPDWARQMTAELRVNPKYRLPAYVFTYGLEERHKEYVRAKIMLDQQRQFAKEKGLPIMYAPRSNNGEAAPELPNNFSLGHLLNTMGNQRVTAHETDDLPLGYALNMLKVKHIQVQCAVLVGGYANENAAKQALTAIKKLPMPDPNKVKLDSKYWKADPKNPNISGGQLVDVNPFERAFVCRNPSIKQERVADSANDGMDINSLRRLNNGEPYTLLNCKKPITLAIKQFQTFTTVQTKDEPNVLQKFGFMTREGEGVDQAAHDAHNLVEYLRKNQLDAYVLHTKFSSVVTVGGFDSLEDPNLRAMQTTLSERLPAFENRLRAANQGKLQSMMFFPRPMPMKVPH